MSFTYTIADGKGGRDTATVTVRVTPVNDVPVAKNDSSSTKVGRAVKVNVLGNDTNADGDRLSVVAVRQPASAQVTHTSDGKLKFTPEASFAGVVTFSYTTDDGSGGRDTATVRTRVTR